MAISKSKARLNFSTFVVFSHKHSEHPHNNIPMAYYYHHRSKFLISFKYPETLDSYHGFKSKSAFSLTYINHNQTNQSYPIIDTIKKTKATISNILPNTNNEGCLSKRRQRTGNTLKE